MSVKSYSGPNIGGGSGDTLVMASMYGLKRNKSERTLLTFHGHNADAYTWRMGYSGAPKMATNLAKKGFVIVSDDFGGNTPWADDAAMTDTDGIFTFATSAVTPLYPNCMNQVSLMGWSMGGLTALNWLKRNPLKISRVVLWAPATQLTYFHANSAYTAEIEAAYGGASWASNIAGHEPAMEPAAYKGLPPVRIYHGDSDTTIPIQQTRDFVTAVNDPNFVLHEVSGGTHTNLFDLVSYEDVSEFLYGQAA